jgi:septum site-determining protein MinD
MMPGKFINVVSGKGGTGKTLLCALLARSLAKLARSFANQETSANQEASILAMDFDIFVRGLTILLTESTSFENRYDGLSISDCINPTRPDGQDWTSRHSDVRLSIRRSLGFDFVPATDDPGDPIEYEELEQLKTTDLKNIISALKERVIAEYDFVLIDNRAGIDRIVIATSEVADVTLSVAEDDEVSIQANLNLVEHLRSRKIKPVYSVINKARRISSVDDLEERKHQMGLNVLGIIPFDRDILDNYGAAAIWEVAGRTLYFYGLASFWNNLAKRMNVPDIKMNLPEITVSRIPRPPLPLRLEGMARFRLVERVALLYGLGGLIGAGTYYIWRKNVTSDPIDTMILLLGGASLGLVIGVITGVVRKLFTVDIYRDNLSRSGAATARGRTEQRSNEAEG